MQHPGAALRWVVHVRPQPGGALDGDGIQRALNVVEREVNHHAGIALVATFEHMSELELTVAGASHRVRALVRMLRRATSFDVSYEAFR